MTPEKEYLPTGDLVSLTGKSAIVTGGAAGIGFAISRRLAEAGATVVIVERTRKGLKKRLRNWLVTVIRPYRCSAMSAAKRKYVRW